MGDRILIEFLVETLKRWRDYGVGFVNDVGAKIDLAKKQGDYVRIFQEVKSLIIRRGIVYLCKVRNSHFLV